MTRKKLLLLWAAMYILCAGLGFIPGFAGELSAGVRGILGVLAVLFFLPPALLLHSGEKESILFVRNAAALSLGLTVVVLLASMALTMAGDWVGVLLHVVLILVSTPMICGSYWVLSLFLWACLLIGGMSALKKMK